MARYPSRSLPTDSAEEPNAFCVEFLNPYLNYHRPCLFATEVPDPRKPGRIKRKYFPKDAMTPLEKLTRLPEVSSFLRPGITIETLTRAAYQFTDLQAAEQLYKARAALFKTTLRHTA